MIKFQCDYMEGAHPEIMRRLNEINLDKNDGYGLDPGAWEGIREICLGDSFLLGLREDGVVLATGRLG